MAPSSESFTFSPEFPLEIWRQIWIYAMEPRVVHANYPWQMRRRGPREVRPGFNYRQNIHRFQPGHALRGLSLRYGSLHNLQDRPRVSYRNPRSRLTIFYGWERLCAYESSSIPWTPKASPCHTQAVLLVGNGRRSHDREDHYRAALGNRIEGESAFPTAGRKWTKCCQKKPFKDGRWWTVFGKIWKCKNWVFQK